MSTEMTKKDRKRLRSALLPIFSDATHRARSTAANLEDVVEVVSILMA